MLSNIIYSGTVGSIAYRVCEHDMFVAFCGYVRLPADHPWRAMEAGDIPADVHGGITYGPDDDGWIGFDTMHGEDAMVFKLSPLKTVIPGRLWTPAAVHIHTVRFALQADDAYARR